MPWTLYRYILKELVRVLVLSSAVLVLVISFAAAIKPLSEGLFEPGTLIRFILYTIPTMLTLVVPFAGAFASTMVFCRMAADNEVMACSASGIGYRSILLPVFVLGLGLAVVLYYMSNWVVPWFFRHSTSLIQQDLPTLVVSQVNKGRPIAIPGNERYVLHANEARTQDVQKLNLTTPKGAMAPNQLISLTGVAFGCFDEQQKLRKLSTAQQADVYLYRLRQADIGLGQNQIWAELRLRDPTGYDPDHGFHIFLGKGDSHAFALPNPLEDDLRFRSWRDLIRVWDHPQHFQEVAKRKLELAQAMARHRLMKNILDQLDREKGVGVITLLDDDGQPHIISAPRVVRASEHLKLWADEIRPVRLDLKNTSGLRTYSYEASSGALVLQSSALSREPVIQINLNQPTVRDVRHQGRATQKKIAHFYRLQWHSPVLSNLLEFSTRQLQDQVMVEFADAPAVTEQASRLAFRVAKTRREIVAQFHERAALAVVSLLVLMLGAVLSIKLRGSMPLVVYFWSFLLASVTVIITRSGENVASDVEFSPGLSFMVIWLGNVVLCVAIGTTYWKMSRS